jgi:hypothetical protein
MMFPLRAAVGVRFLVAALPLHGVGALLIGRKRWEGGGGGSNWRHEPGTDLPHPGPPRRRIGGIGDYGCLLLHHRNRFFIHLLLQLRDVPSIDFCNSYLRLCVWVWERERERSDLSSVSSSLCLGQLRVMRNKTSRC